MADLDSISSCSDSDELDWSFAKKNKLQNYSKAKDSSLKNINSSSTLSEKHQKFEELKKKSDHIRTISNQILLRSEKKRSQKLVKKALKDPFIKQEVEKNKVSVISNQSSDERDKEEWNNVKPFLTANKHLQGPISHGVRGPKTELESTIEDAIKEGDFQKAEIMSDTLANKQFAKEICKAYSAKRYHEKIEEQKAIDKAQQMKKVRWTFEAKEKWQMKGNM